MGKLLKNIGIGIAKVCFLLLLLSLVTASLLLLVYSISLMVQGFLFKGGILLAGLIIFVGILVGLENYYD